MDDTPLTVGRYRRRRPAKPDPNVQRQTATCWDAAEKLGYEAIEIDGASLEVDLPRC
jgi:hypothetical protein